MALFRVVMFGPFFLLLLLSRHHAQVVATTGCAPTEFSCDDSGSQCIPGILVCDGSEDCFNGGADEKECPPGCTGPNKIHCENGRCVSLSKRCDRVNDCGDFTDEAACHEYQCPEATSLRCNTTDSCYNKNGRCDGYAECEDASDEVNCVTTCDSRFKCANGQKCVPFSFQCDGFSDCVDGSDEAGCSCASDKFHCTNGKCIPNRYKCDMDNDCGDLSDEVNCPAGTTTNYCKDELTFADCVRMNETAHPICTIYADSRRFCKKFCGLCS